jgi:hypothetical protein
MTERQSDHGVDTHLRLVAMLMGLSVSILLCACSSNSGASTGVLKGTASPCTGPATYQTSHAWAIKVTLRRGSTVISTKTVVDTQAADEPVLHQIFTFTEPAGSYSVSESTPKEQSVVIKAGTTSTVELPDACT